MDLHQFYVYIISSPLLRPLLLRFPYLQGREELGVMSGAFEFWKLWLLSFCIMIHSHYHNGVFFFLWGLTEFWELGILGTDLVLTVFFFLSLRAWLLIVIWFLLAPLAHQWDLGPVYVSTYTLLSPSSSSSISIHVAVLSAHACNTVTVILKFSFLGLGFPVHWDEVRGETLIFRSPLSSIQVDLNRTVQRRTP